MATAARPNLVVLEMEKVAAQLSEEISAQQQAIVPASPVVPIPTPNDVPDNAISTISSTLAASAGNGDTGLAIARPELAAAIALDQEVSGNISAKLRESLALSTVQADILSDALLSKEVADKTIALQRDSVDMRAQNATIQANREAGGVERQTALMSRLQEDQKRTRTLQEEKLDITDDVFTGIGLIDQIINDFRSLQTDAELDVARRLENTTVNQIQAITSSTQAVATSTQLTRETINKGVIAANQDKIHAISSIEQVKAQIAMVQSNAGIMQSLQAASRGQITSLIAVAQLRATDEGQMIARERLAITRENMVTQRLLNEQRLRQGELDFARTQISLAIEQNLAPTEVEFRRTQLANLITSGEQTRLNLAESVVTSDARVAEIQTRSDLATTQLGQANAALDRYIGTDADVREKLSLDVQRAQQELNVTEFEFANAIKAQPDIEAARTIGLLISSEQLTGLARVNISGKATTATATEATIAENQQRVRNVRDTEEYYDFIVPLVQKGQAMLYGEGNNIEPRGVIIAGISPGATQESREKYATLSDMGATNQIGDTPFETAVNLTSAAPSGIIPENKTTQLIADVQNEQNRIYAEDTAKVPTSAQEQAADFNKTALAVMKRHGQNIKSGDATNPFHAPSLPSLVLFSAELAKSPLYTKILKDSGITEGNPDKIVERTLAGIISRTITPNQAVDGLTLIYESAINYNNTLDGGFARVGLPSQGSYLTMLPNPDAQGFFGALITDISAFGEVAKASPLAIAGIGLAAGTLAAVSAPVTLTAAVGTTILSQFLPTRNTETRVNMSDFNEVKAYITAMMNSFPLKANKSTGE